MKIVLPPQSLDILKTRVSEIAGLSLGQCAIKYDLIVPTDQKYHKGWIGVLMERVLGADANSKPVPDFTKLGVELKTVPLGINGRPMESTFVASIDLLKVVSEQWTNSVVKKKLSHVLWLPVEGAKEIPLRERRVGNGFFWHLDGEEEDLIKRDWCELTDLIALGKLEKISAHLGEVMQIRPKAADGRALRVAIGSKGQRIKTLPRGFYLRSSFTQALLTKGLGL